MKRSNYTRYEVVSPKNDCGLCVNHCEDFDEVVHDISEVVKRAKELGYNNDEKWLIVRVDGYTDTRDDGTFVASSVVTEAVALYDNGSITMLEE